MENVKKCKSFLSTLIKLASTGKQSTETAASVRELVKDLLVSESYIQKTHMYPSAAIHVSNLTWILNSGPPREASSVVALTPGSLCIYVVLGGQTGSGGIHQQIVQRAKLLTPTLPCAFPQGKNASVLL